MNKAWQWQIEFVVSVAGPSEACSGNGVAVVSQQMRHEFLFFWLAYSVPVIPTQSSRTVDRLGTRAGKPYFGHGGRRHGQQFFSQSNHRLMAFVVGEWVISQLQHLLVCGIGQALIAITQGNAPQTRHAFNVVAAMNILNPDTLARLNDAGAALSMKGQVG